MSEKREMSVKQSKGLSVQDILLVGILLAAGAVLKFFVGSFVNFGLKPNFIIAMYCLAMLIIRPSVLEALIIGLLAGVVCQFFPGTPYLNLFSETVGALVMVVLMMIPFDLKITKYSLNPSVTTFITTLFSGFTFLGLLYVMVSMGSPVKAPPVMVFMSIILGTALANAIIVQVLYLPLKLALRKD